MKIPFRFGIVVLAIGSQLLAISAQAHPGHGPGDVSTAHYLLNPDHLGACLVAAVMLFCLIRALNWRRGANTP
jgi:hypothetical protein